MQFVIKGSVLTPMSEQEKKVKIKLVSTIVPIEGEHETYEMWLEGSVVYKGGNDYLRYDEVQEDQTIRTTIKLATHGAVILRNGAVKMRMPLNLEQPELGHYESMYGSLPIETTTHQLAIEQLAGGATRFMTQYDLRVAGDSVGHYTLEIHFTEVEA